MRITPQELALAAIVAAGLSPAVAAVSGLADRKIRREERREARVEDRRRAMEEAYIDALAFAERLEQQVSARVYMVDQAPDPMPSEDWLRLLARLHAYGSEEVRALVTQLATARSDFELLSDNAVDANQHAIEARKRLEEPVNQMPASVTEFLEKLRFGDQAPAAPTHTGVFDPQERQQLQERYDAAMAQRGDAAGAMMGIAEALPDQVEALRQLIRTELRLP